jgi:hypothetical protein
MCFAVVRHAKPFQFLETVNRLTMRVETFP